MFSVVDLNFWAVVVAWLINIVIGALWYSPLAFARRWEKFTGIDIMKIPEKEATRAIGYVALSGLIQAFALAMVLNGLNVLSVQDGLLAGFVLWFGFTAATTIGVTFYSRRGWGYWWLNSSYFLVVMMLNSYLLTIWQ
jgi:hypothetical protein